jgi:hypothetical protein
MITPGERFAKALAAKDEAGVRAVTSSDLDFRAMTPGRFWEAHSHDDLVDVLFGGWLEPSDEVLALVSTRPDRCRRGSTSPTACACATRTASH